MDFNRRDFLKAAGCSAVLGLFGCSQNMGRIGGMRKRPNIVLVISDDQRQDMLSCMGNKYTKTPNFDRMAKEGMVFENAFCTSGVCSPSRASFLTGKHPHQAGSPGILWTNNTFLNNEKTVAWYLQKAGYATGHVGKWHLGKGDHPKPGYDYWAGFKFLGNTHDPVITINGKPEKFNGFCDDVLSEIAADYIKDASGGEKPFFLFVGLKSPHLPFAYPQRYNDFLENTEIPRPESYNEDYDESGKPEFMKNNLIRLDDFKGGGIPYFGSWDKYIKSYYRSSQALDDAMGNILKALDEAGCAENTLVIYSSDQGYTLGEHGNTEKHYAYEEVIRLPMLLRWPEIIRPGTSRKEMVLNIDVMPTLLDIAGVEIPEEVAGKSWSGLLISEHKKHFRDDFLFKQESPGSAIPGQIAVRTERYKLITYQSFPDEELYDLERNPQETHNLVNDPSYASVLVDMRQRLDRLKRETNLRPYVDHPLESIRIMKCPADESCQEVGMYISNLTNFHQELNCQDISYRWEKLDAYQPGKFRLPADYKNADPVLLGYYIEVLDQKDPYTTLKGPGMESVGYCNGTRIWDTEIKVLNPFNPPLKPGRNIILLKSNPTQNGEFVLEIYAPQQSVKIY